MMRYYYYYYYYYYYLLLSFFWRDWASPLLYATSTRSEQEEKWEKK